MSQFIAHTCTLVACIVTILAFWIYNQKEDSINTGTWIILAVGDSLELASYFDMTGQDVWKSLLPGVFACGSIYTFIKACYQKRFCWPDNTDKVIICVDLGITFLWAWSESNDVALLHSITNSAAANLGFQATTFLAFIPLYRGIVNGNEEEGILPWFLNMGAFVLFAISSILTYDDYVEIAYPIVNVLTHGAVILCIFVATNRYRRQNPLQT